MQLASYVPCNPINALARRASNLIGCWFHFIPLLALLAAGVACAELPQGSSVGWGSQFVGVDLSQGFIAVAAGRNHNLGLKADGSIAQGVFTQNPNPIQSQRAVETLAL